MFIGQIQAKYGNHATGLHGYFDLANASALSQHTDNQITGDCKINDLNIHYCFLTKQITIPLFSVQTKEDKPDLSYCMYHKQYTALPDAC